MSQQRWWSKANAYASAWKSVFGVDPSPENTALGLSVAEHETACGDAWPGEYNWGACTRGALTEIQKAALSSGGIRPILSPASSRKDSEIAATKTLATAGKPVPANACIHVDSSPQAGSYFTLFGKFSDDVAGATYFVNVLAKQRPSCRVVLDRRPSPFGLAVAMYETHYYTGFFDPHGWFDPKTRKPCDALKPGAIDGVTMNITDYGNAVSKILPGVMEALSGWTPGATAPASVPPGPPDLKTTLGVQRALNQLIGAELAEDGIPGPKTTEAIRRFQASRGLTADGIVGAKTRAALAASIKAS